MEGINCYSTFKTPCWQLSISPKSFVCVRRDLKYFLSCASEQCSAMLPNTNGMFKTSEWSQIAFLSPNGLKEYEIDLWTTVTLTGVNYMPTALWALTVAVPNGDQHAPPPQHKTAILVTSTYISLGPPLFPNIPRILTVWVSRQKLQFRPRNLDLEI